MTGRRLQNTLTALVALVVTGASATGMWKYFEVQLHITNVWLRAALFAVLELSLLVSALRARRYRIDHNRAGIDDAAVWGLAVLTGVLAATDEATLGARMGRVALPLVAAFLFERAISAERADKTSDRTDIHWRVSLERIAVWLRLADAQDRGVVEVDRARRIARLARVAYRAHTSARWLRPVAQRRLRRGLADANERLGLASDGAAVDELRSGVALLFQAVEETSAAAVASASPWRRDEAGEPPVAAVSDLPEPDTSAAPPRPPARPSGRPSAATKVAKAAAKMPDASVDKIAAKTKVSQRTVRRHLAAMSTPETAATEPANGHDLAHLLRTTD